MTDENTSNEGKAGEPLNLNVAENSRALNITESIYIRILQKAIMQTTQDIKIFQEALPANDYEKVKAISHKFKGDFDNLRIEPMAVIAREMNQLAKAEGDKEKIAKLLNDFLAYFQQLKGEVEKQAT